MVTTVWEMPIPPTAMTRGPTFTELPKRQCELAYYVEAEVGDRKQSLMFFGVEAYKCTYLAAHTADMIKAAYGKVADLGESDWLTEISERTTHWYTANKRNPPALKHLAIYFDGDRCFEFICERFQPPREFRLS